MYEDSAIFTRPFITAFVTGVLFGFCIAAAIAGWLYLHLSDAWQGKPSDDDIARKILNNS